MKTSFQSVLLALLLVYALIRFSDGITPDDGSAILMMFAFCAVIRLFSGAENMADVVLWVKAHRSSATHLLFGIGFVSAVAISGTYKEQVPDVTAAEVFFTAVFFFTALIVVGTRIGDQFSKNRDQ